MLIVGLVAEGQLRHHSLLVVTQGFFSKHESFTCWHLVFTKSDAIVLFALPTQ